MEFMCRTCRVTKPSSEFYYKGPNRSDPDCKECRIAGTLVRRAAYKVAVYARLGGVCFCCGETRVPFLGIDHKDGLGASHRRELNNIGGKLFMWLHGRPEEDHRFQLACHNCNLGRHINGGVCPHQEGVPQ